MAQVSQKHYDFTRFQTPDLTKAKISLILVYAEEEGFSGEMLFSIKPEVFDQMKKEGGLEEIKYSHSKDYIQNIEYEERDEKVYLKITVKP